MGKNYRLKARYRLRTANLYVGHPDPQEATDLLVQGKPVIVALQEISPRWVQPLESIEGYLFLQRNDGSKGRREVGLLIREDALVIDWGVRQMSDHIENDKFGHDRHGIWAKVILPWGGGKTLAYSTHKNAVVQGRYGRVIKGRRTDEYKGHALQEAQFLHNMANSGWPVLGGQDANFAVPRGVVRFPRQAWKFSPQRLLSSLNIRYVGHGVDGLMFNKKSFRKVGGKWIITRKRNGGDHDWLTIAITRRRPRK